MALRRPALAAVVWLVAVTAAWSRWDDLPFVAAQMLIILFVLHRLGLLAAAVTISTHLMLIFVPLTVLPQGAVVVGVMMAMMVYAVDRLKPVHRTNQRWAN